MATHIFITPEIRPAAAPGLPIAAHPDVYPRFTQADPIPGLASAVRHGAVLSTCDAAAQARAMNAILADLNAILADGGARG